MSTATLLRAHVAKNPSNYVLWDFDGKLAITRKPEHIASGSPPLVFLQFRMHQEMTRMEPTRYHDLAAHLAPSEQAFVELIASKVKVDTQEMTNALKSPPDSHFATTPTLKMEGDKIVFVPDFESCHDGCAVCDGPLMDDCNACASITLDDEDKDGKKFSTTMPGLLTQLGDAPDVCVPECSPGLKKAAISKKVLHPDNNDVDSGFFECVEDLDAEIDLDVSDDDDADFAMAEKVHDQAIHGLGPVIGTFGGDAAEVEKAAHNSMESEKAVFKKAHKNNVAGVDSHKGRKAEKAAKAAEDAAEKAADDAANAADGTDTKTALLEELSTAVASDAASAGLPLLDQACKLFKDKYENNNAMTSTVGAIFLGYNERGGDPNLKKALEATTSFRDVKPAMEEAMTTHNQPSVWGNQPMRKVVGYLSTSTADEARDVVWCQAEALLESVITTLEDKPLKALKTAENVAKIVKMVAQWSPMQKVLEVIRKIIKWVKDQVEKWIEALKKVQESTVFKRTVGTMCTLGTRFQNTLGKIRTVCFMNDIMSDECKRKSFINNIDLKNMANERKNREIAAAKEKCDEGGFGQKVNKLKDSIDKGKSMLEKLAKAVRFAKAARDKVQPIVDKLNKRHSICYIKLPSCCCGSFPSCGWRGCRGGRLPRCHLRCHRRWSGSVMDIIKVITGTIGRLMGFVTRPVNGIINRITDFIARQITNALERFIPKVEELVPPMNVWMNRMDHLISRLPDPMAPFKPITKMFKKMTKKDNTDPNKCPKKSKGGSSSGVVPGMVIALKGGKDNKYCADEGHTIKCNRGGVGGWEKFYVEDGGGGKIALRGGRNKKFCADEGSNGIKCNRGGVGGWEKFTVEMLGGGKLALKGGKDNKYCADEGSMIKCNRGGVGGWEKFTFEVLK